MSFLDTIRDGLSSMVAPARSFLGTLAPMAGTALGGYFGGPIGATLGGAGGSFLGNLIRGNDGHSYDSPGSAATNLLTSAIPSGYGDSSMRQIGQNFMGSAGSAIDGAMGRYVNPMLSRLGIGNGIVDAGSNWLSDRLRSSYPGVHSAMSNYSQMTPNQMSSSAGQYLNSRMMPGMYPGSMPGGLSSPGGNFMQPPRALPSYGVNPGMVPHSY